MPPISLTQSSNPWGEVVPSLVSTPDIFAFAEGVYGTLDIPSIWLPSSEVDKLVLTVESYEEIVIEIPNEFFEAPDQVLEILDHGDDHENGHEDTFNPSSAELRRRVKRDALPSPEPGCSRLSVSNTATRR